MAQSITINADVGEGYDGVVVGDDEAILPLVQAINIACGMHGGDPKTMHRLVGAAKAQGLSIGAHPGFDDLEGMGRRPIEMSQSDLEYLIAYQIGALQSFCTYHGTKLTHVKAHGALYNMAAKRVDYANALAEAMARLDDSLKMVGLPNSEMAQAAEAKGLDYINEVFADRVYDDDGHLIPRSQPGAVLHDPDMIASRALSMVQAGTVESLSGRLIAVPVDTICVHGDTPESIDISKNINDLFAANGIALSTFS